MCAAGAAGVCMGRRRRARAIFEPSHRHHPRLSGVVIPSREEEEEEEGVRQKTMTERVNLALVYVYTAKSCTLVPFVTN